MSEENNHHEEREPAALDQCEGRKMDLPNGLKQVETWNTAIRQARLVEQRVKVLELGVDAVLLRKQAQIDAEKILKLEGVLGEFSEAARLKRITDKEALKTDPHNLSVSYDAYWEQLLKAFRSLDALNKCAVGGEKP